MQTNVGLSWNSIGASALGILAAVLVFAFFTGRRFPLIADDRQAFIALVVIGFAMCSVGMGSMVNSMGWSHWTIIAGSILGVAAMALIIAVLMGIKLPLISGYREAIIGLSAIGFTKWLIAFLR